MNLLKRIFNPKVYLVVDTSRSYEDVRTGIFRAYFHLGEARGRAESIDGAEVFGMEVGSDE